MSDYLCNVKNYFAAKYTVCNSFWNNVCEKAAVFGYDLEKRNGGGELPVTRVNFYDAVKFSNALNEICGLLPVYFQDEEPVRTGRKDDAELKGKGFRLPSEEEWEYAACGDKDTLYFWGDEKGDNKCNEYAWMYDLNDEENAFLIRKPGMKKPNEFGLYDVSGNVYEWCSDKFRATPFRVLKGGSVTLDSVLETRFTSFATMGMVAMDIGLRIFSDIDIEIPDELFKENESTESFKNYKYDFFEFINIDTPGLEKVRNLYESGNVKEAKREYICILKKRAETADFDYSFYMPVKMEALKKLLAKMPEDIKWFEGNRNYSSYHGLVIFAFPLTEMCRVEKEKKYLDAFIRVTEGNSYAKDVFDNLKPEQMNRVSVTVPDSWFYTQGFDSCKRLEHVATIVLSMFLKYIDYEDLDEAMVDALTAHMTRTLAEDLPLVLKDSRSVIPNQSLENAMSLIYAGNILVGCKYADDLKRIGYERMLEATLGKCVFPDGTDMEQSYNYNFAICKNVKSLISYFGELPEELLPLKDAAINRIRFLKAVSYPHGGYPATGTMSGTFPPKDCKTLDEIDCFATEYDGVNFNKFKDIDDEELDVTSVYFPYSATAILKNSNARDAVYMWHFAARQGSGHAVENINSVQMSAFGMPMIVNAGAATYGNVGFVPKEQWDMIPEYDKYQHSSYGSNTVLIDGMGQGRLRYGENVRIDKYTTCCDNAFFTNEDFDYSKGKYEGVYYNSEGELSAEHIREVIYLKKHNVFILKDTLKADGEHEFSARFGIMPEDGQNRKNSVGEELYLTAGYCEDEVVIEKNRVYTKKKGYPNFAIFVPQEGRKITSEYGEKKPCRGWFRGAIRSAAKEKYDISVSWKGNGITENLTVIAVSPDEALPVKDITFSDGVLKINTDRDVITFDGEAVVTNSGQKFEIKNAGVPTGFKWVKKGDKMVVDYGF